MEMLLRVVVALLFDKDVSPRTQTCKCKPNKKLSPNPLHSAKRPKANGAKVLAPRKACACSTSQSVSQSKGTQFVLHSVLMCATATCCACVRAFYPIFLLRYSSNLSCVCVSSFSVSFSFPSKRISHVRLLSLRLQRLRLRLDLSLGLRLRMCDVDVDVDAIWRRR